VLQKILGGILGCALWLYGGAAFSFTLPFPEEQLTPSSTVTEATALETQVQSIAGAIRGQLLGLRGLQSSRRVTQARGVLVASAAADLTYLAAAAGSGNGGAIGDTESLWISAAANSLENTFDRTAFHGATHNLLVGFDLTRSAKYVLGVAVGHEASNFNTTFNVGNERTRGYNVAPYFAYLLSDSWSVDLSAGYGEFDTRQSRTLFIDLPPPTVISVDSEFSSRREFVSTNLTNISGLGNWVFTGSLGLLAAKRKNEAYLESSALGNAVAASKQTTEQWNLLGEIAYGRGGSETYFGLTYEDTRDPPKTQFTTGPQPANDPDSVLLTAGWRHFGKGLTANFVFNKRVSQDQVNEYGFSMMIRVDL
jgi:hypothetical protein